MGNTSDRGLHEILDRLASTGRNRFVLGDIAQLIAVSAARERTLFRELTRRGYMLPIQRGQYLLRPANLDAPVWSPTDALVLKSLILDAGGQYQLCGPSAFHYYGWDDQVPNRVFAYNTLISGVRSVGAVTMTLIKVDASRLGATDTVSTPDGNRLVWPTRERALLDAVYDWSRFNSLPRGYEWIRQELRRDDSLAAALVEVALQFANQGTLRRIGWLFEREDVSVWLVRRLERRVNRSSSFIAWDPTRPKRGTVDRRWGVVANHGS